MPIAEATAREPVVALPDRRNQTARPTRLERQPPPRRSSRASRQTHRACTGRSRRAGSRTCRRAPSGAPPAGAALWRARPGAPPPSVTGRPSASSTKRRRPSGPPFTNTRSSGVNMLTRNAPRRSRALCNGCRLICARRRPRAGSSASSSRRRSSRSPSARTTARSAPIRTSASFGAPRNEVNVASQAMASRRFVFPCPLAPATTVRPSGARSSVVCSYERKSTSSKCSSLKPSSA